MTAVDLRRLTDVIKRLCAVFNRFYSEALLEGYSVGLRDADISRVEANAIAWLTIGKAMPTPYDLSRAADAPSTERAALAAWRAAIDCVKTRKVCDDRVAHEIVLGFGGYHAIGQMSSEQVHGWLRREFVQAYIAASRDEELQALAASLEDRTPRLPA